MKRQRVQYLPLTRPNGTFHFVKKLGAKGITTILDLEDTAKDVVSESRTADLKRLALDGLRLIANKDWTDVPYPYLRINGSNTNYYDRDFSAVCDLVDSGFEFQGFFLPKIETVRQLGSLSDDFDTNGINGSFVLMIETELGLKNIEKIIVKAKQIERDVKFHFGHFDYFFDAGYWPFPRVNEVEYWTILKKLLLPLEASGLDYIHAPPGELYDTEEFNKVIARIAQIAPKLSFTMSTLNYDLSICAIKNTMVTPLIELNLNTSERLAYARSVIESFESGQAVKRSFAIFGSRFIPPQEFLAAKLFIENQVNH